MIYKKEGTIEFKDREHYSRFADLEAALNECGAEFRVYQGSKAAVLKDGRYPPQFALPEHSTKVWVLPAPNTKYRLYDPGETMENAQHTNDPKVAAMIATDRI